MNNIIEVYYSLLGTLIVYPKMNKYVYVNANLFEKPFDHYFEAIVRLIKENKEATLIDCKNQGIPNEEFIEMSDHALGTSKDAFNRYQDLIVEYAKKKEILSLTNDLKRGLIGIDEFAENVSKAKEISRPHDLNEITEQKMIAALSKGTETIKFDRFQNFKEIAGLAKGDFAIVAGATGAGKSGFALNLMEDLIGNYQCIYLNMEISENDLIFRIVSNVSGVPIRRAKLYSKNKNLLKQEEINDLSSAIHEIGTKNKFYVQTRSYSINQIASLVSNFDQEKHTILFVDHIGLISAPDARNEYSALTDIAKKLRALALNYNFTIIALCQLNREGRKENVIPRLYHLRDSGEIEQSATHVIMLYKENNDPDDDVYKVSIEKNRSGQCGSFSVRYDKMIQRFEEIRR